MAPRYRPTGGARSARRSCSSSSSAGARRQPRSRHRDRARAAGRSAGARRRRIALSDARPRRRHLEPAGERLSRLDHDQREQRDAQRELRARRVGTQSRGRALGAKLAARDRVRSRYRAPDAHLPVSRPATSRCCRCAAGSPSRARTSRSPSGCAISCPPACATARIHRWISTDRKRPFSRSARRCCRSSNRSARRSRRSPC